MITGNWIQHCLLSSTYSKLFPLYCKYYYINLFPSPQSRFIARHMLMLIRNKFLISSFNCNDLKLFSSIIKYFCKQSELYNCLVLNDKAGKLQQSDSVKHQLSCVGDQGLECSHMCSGLHMACCQVLSLSESRERMK